MCSSCKGGVTERVIPFNCLGFLFQSFTEPDEAFEASKDPNLDEDAANIIAHRQMAIALGLHDRHRQSPPSIEVMQ